MKFNIEDSWLEVGRRSFPFGTPITFLEVNSLGFRVFWCKVLDRVFRVRLEILWDLGVFLGSEILGNIEQALGKILDPTLCLFLLGLLILWPNDRRLGHEEVPWFFCVRQQRPCLRGIQAEMVRQERCLLAVYVFFLGGSFKLTCFASVFGNGCLQGTARCSQMSSKTDRL